MTNERASKSATGGEKNVKDERFDLIPVDALTQLARHYGAGARKYDDNQWRKGYEYSKSYAALQRHLTQWWGGEDIDEETGSNHMAAVAWHAFTLLTFIKDYPEFDDRYVKSEPEPEVTPASREWDEEDREMLTLLKNSHPELANAVIKARASLAGLSVSPIGRLLAVDSEGVARIVA